jgi:hypothetical protein
MVKLADIIEKVVTDMMLRSSRRILPHYVPDNQFSSTHDPKLRDAKQAALQDMEGDGDYIHPELVENE